MKLAFVGIGAQKCASTWLYRILAAHPQIAMSDKKELDFFSYRFDRGYQWYESHFDVKAGGRAIGEVSPSYFCEGNVPERLAAYAPQAKILVSFRDPVERVLSNHRHEVRAGHFSGRDLSVEAGLANNPMYIEQGLYAKHLKRWLQYFPSAQVLAILMDDVRTKPEEVARRVYGFLDLDSGYVPQGLGEHFNRSFAPRSHTTARFKDRVYGFTRRPVLRWIWRLAAAVGGRALYRKVNVVPSDAVIPAPSEELLRRLRSEFAEDTAELATLLNRNLDGWLKQ